MGVAAQVPVRVIRVRFGPFGFALSLFAATLCCAAHPAGAAQPAGAASSQAAGATVPDALAGSIAAAGSAKPSRWKADEDRLGAAVRQRLLAPRGASEHWLAARFDVTDIASQVANLARARVSSPEQRLYLASLAVACMQPTRPQLPDCATVDRLADWATRDRDNGVPSILLGYRALARRDPDTAAADVEEASRATRFDDYWSAAGAQWWNYLKRFDSDADPAVRAELAITWSIEHDPEWISALHALCVEPRPAARMRAACEKLGVAMARRASTFALRRAGARVAAVNAEGEEAKAGAGALQARALEASARCAEVQPDFESELESADRGVRERAVEAWGRWVAARAELGEVAACARAVSARPR